MSCTSVNRRARRGLDSFPPRPSAQQNQNQNQNQSECASNASSGSPLPALSPAPVGQAAVEASSRATGNAPKRRRSQEDFPNQLSSNGRRDRWGPEVPTSRVLVIRSTVPITNGIESWRRVQMTEHEHAAQPPSPSSQPFPGAGDTEWTIDPYLSNGEATLRLVDNFFEQEYCFFLYPPSAFKRWVMNCRDKSREELMVLYSLLAISSAQIAENTGFSKTCTERAVNAVASNFGVFSLALVQSRLFLSTLFLSKGQENLYWEYSGAMLRALSAERLNVEEGCRDKKGVPGRNLFDLTDLQLTECKRRTFWAAFFTDVSCEVRVLATSCCRKSCTDYICSDWLSYLRNRSFRSHCSRYISNCHAATKITRPVNHRWHHYSLSAS